MFYSADFYFQIEHSSFQSPHKPPLCQCKRPSRLLQAAVKPHPSLAVRLKPTFQGESSAGIVLSGSRAHHPRYRSW